MSEEKRQQVLALGRLGWPLRRIQQERDSPGDGGSLSQGCRNRRSGARRLGAARGGKPANEVSPDPTAACPTAPDQNRPTVSPDSDPVPQPSRTPTGSACEPYFDFIELSLSKGRNAKAIYQDLVDQHGFAARYASVKRFVRNLGGKPAQPACAVIVTVPGEDYGESGVMVRTRRRSASGAGAASYRPFLGAT